MTIDEFANITQRIISRNGYGEHLPTLCLPARRHIAVLQGVPNDKRNDIRHIALKWAEEKAGGSEEFLLAFKEGPDQICVIRRYAGREEERVFKAYGNRLPYNHSPVRSGPRPGW